MFDCPADFQMRPSEDSDWPFLLSLSPRLADVPRPAWQEAAAMAAFQEHYMRAYMQPPAPGAATFIAVALSGERAGYIHVQPGEDGVTGEACGFIPLLAVAAEFEGQGVAARLMRHAEAWSRARGYRLLSLDVFATNTRAMAFYERAGFLPETVRVVKPL